jgi:hypothetical protein
LTALLAVKLLVISIALLTEVSETAPPIGAVLLKK